MEHRSSTSTRHLTLFCAVSFVSRLVSPLSSNSNILVRLQVCWCLPLLPFPCEFYSRTLLATCPSGLPSVWPIQPHARCFISSSIGCCPVCFQSSSLQILRGHQIRRMLLRLLLMNTCNFCFNPLVSLQVSKPYKSTAFTFDPEILS